MKIIGNCGKFTKIKRNASKFQENQKEILENSLKSKEIQEISATKIRAQMRKDGKLK